MISHRLINGHIRQILFFGEFIRGMVVLVLCRFCKFSVNSVTFGQYEAITTITDDLSLLTKFNISCKTENGKSTLLHTTKLPLNLYDNNVHLK